ncbi:major facilitator superfamily domain-containing protein 4A isoform X1 [Alligator mississippiensis]|uniref:Major facilitator superfamily domain-containing protein 4A n=1 Tax=Alligator mississippiensis TaxID=8496 RepID=A0A151MAT0_ALLMI|nr:major facilitator superfamily domain-containing protein 4A isoform X1 [Alligator mississippiensis]KYO21633.1 major facilitator superfamily domain-containing protein 4 [Alligator mississippiensis]
MRGAARVWALLGGHLQPTLTYWSVFFSFGLCLAFLGPTLLDLRCQTHSSLPQLTWVFFSQQFCLLLGSCLGGLFKRTLAQSLIALFASSLAISVVFAIIPLCHNVVLLAVVMAVAGLAMGCIDTIANMQLVKIYQKDSAVFLQALHFFVGFGALLSPLIADPFLSESNCIQSNATLNATSNLPHIRKSLVPHHPGNFSHYDLPMEGVVVTRVSYAFWIMALINLPVPIAVFFLLYKERLVPCLKSSSPPLLSADELAMETRPVERDTLSAGSRTAQPDGGHNDLFSCCQSKNFRGASYSYFAVHITGALVLFMTDGITGEYSGFIYSYAVEEPLSVGHKMAGYLPSLFWGFITLGRLISILVSYRMKPTTMVFINVVGVLVTFLLLLIFSHSVAFLFVGTACLGLFLSSTFPSMLAYTEDILQYKGCATTVLVTGAGFGEMTLQLLVGSIIHEQGSYSFLVCGMIFGGLAFTFYTFLLFFHRMHPKPSSDPDASPDKPTVTDDSGLYQQ